jgi:hypothetical protein
VEDAAGPTVARVEVVPSSAAAARGEVVPSGEDLPMGWEKRPRPWHPPRAHPAPRAPLADEPRAPTLPWSTRQRTAPRGSSPPLIHPLTSRGVRRSLDPPADDPDRGRASGGGGVVHGGSSCHRGRRTRGELFPHLVVGFFLFSML